VSPSSFHHRRIVKKSEHWHRHGKHRPILGWLMAWQRSRIQRPVAQMYATVREAFDAARRGR
jgi:hypothetical protein